MGYRFGHVSSSRSLYGFRCSLSGFLVLDRNLHRIFRRPRRHDQRLSARIGIRRARHHPTRQSIQLLHLPILRNLQRRRLHVPRTHTQLIVNDPRL